MIHGYLVESDSERRMEAPRLFLFLVAIDLPFSLTFRQTLKYSVSTAVIAPFAFVEDTHNVEL